MKKDLCGFIRFAGLAVFTVVVTAATASAQQQDTLFAQSLEELMEVQVVTVGKKEQSIFDSAASVYVVTRDEIRRSGLSTVPELLRLVPGVTVSRIDSSKWAISVRGFSGRFANKLLVMIDGRSLYSRLFSGVFWDALAVPVAEIERIEVIRGPGASVWGANAVNGVVNIVTRGAAAAPGTSVAVATGSADRFVADASHTVGQSGGAMRLFSHVSDTGETEFDGWREAVAGVRLERGRAAGARLTLQANIARSDAGQRSFRFESIAAPSIVVDDVRVVTDSWNAVGTWIVPRGAHDEWQVIGTIDRTERYEPGFYRYRRQIADLGVQHHVGRWRRQDVVWGAGIRHSRDDMTSEGPTMGAIQPTFGETLFNSFVQDEITMAPTFKVTLGTKVERTAVTGWNLQPSARAWWSPDGSTAMWGAVSRALRTPSWTDTGMRLNLFGDTTSGPVPLLFALIGNPEARNEQLTAYEVGVRNTTFDRLAVDLSGFYNRYTGLLVYAAQTPAFEIAPFAPHMLIGISPQNASEAATAGFETVATVGLSAAWTLTGTFEFFKLVDASSSVPTSPGFIDGATPRFQWSLRSNFSRGGFDYDASLFKAARLTGPVVPGYLRLDARIARQLKPRLELALVGQNLLDAQHMEAGPDLVDATAVRRALSLRAVWRFSR
jgi:iron complex outermembrane receptor protein